MDSFKNWLNKQEKKLEVATDTAQVAVFARPIAMVRRNPRKKNNAKNMWGLPTL